MFFPQSDRGDDRPEVKVHYVNADCLISNIQYLIEDPSAPSPDYTVPPIQSAGDCYRVQRLTCI